jgi:hypothetical protein
MLLAPGRIYPVLHIFSKNGGYFMKLNKFFSFAGLLAVALFSYTTGNAQIVDAVKDAASATKNVTVKAAKKTADVTKDTASKTKVVVEDAYDKAAEKTPEIAGETKDATVKTGKVAASTTNKIGEYSINVTEGAAGHAYEGGRWLMTSTWDGTKWVSKRIWYPTKKAASATKDAVMGEKP